MQKAWNDTKLKIYMKIREKTIIFEPKSMLDCHSTSVTTDYDFFADFSIKACTY